MPLQDAANRLKGTLQCLFKVTEYPTMKYKSMSTGSNRVNEIPEERHNNTQSPDGGVETIPETS